MEVFENLKPREKLEVYGEKELTDEELLAIIISKGIRGHDVFQICRELTEKYKNLINLSQASIEELSEINGLGRIKSLHLKAALELGRRYHLQKAKEERVKILSPEVAYRVSEDMIYYEQETVRVLLLDSKLNMIGYENISTGTVNASMAHPRDIFRHAIRLNATSIILVHNHPSGDPTPSMQDIDLTENVKKSGELLDIKLNDHLIIGKGIYYSFSLARKVSFNDG